MVGQSKAEREISSSQSRAPRPELLPGMGSAVVDGLRVVAQARSNNGVSATRIPVGQLRVMGEGRPLEPRIRQAMEASFQADFSSVRVHEGPTAHALGALAFTLGEDLHFAPGRYDPTSSEGVALIGHELAHVVQQREGRVANPYGRGVALVQDPALEAEADRMGWKVAAEMSSGSRAERPSIVGSRNLEGRLPAVQLMEGGAPAKKKQKRSHEKREETESDQSALDVITDDLLWEILSYLESKDLRSVALVMKRFYRLSRRRELKTGSLFYSTKIHGARILTEGHSIPVFIDSGEWFFLKNIDDQTYGPYAIASQNRYGTYQFSALSSGGTNQALTTLDTNTTVGVVKINGFFFGLFLTRAFHNILESEASEYTHPWKCKPEYPPDEDEKKNKKNKKKPEEVIHNHMEDHFLEAMNRLLTDKALNEVLEALLARSSDGKTLVITLKGTKSPCFKCVGNLIKFVTEAREIRILLRCKAFGIYEGESLTIQIAAITSLVKNKIAIIPWGIAERGGKLYTKGGLWHEFANWQKNWKSGEFAAHFEQQQELKTERFFNLTKQDAFDKKYVDLRRLLFKSLHLYKKYGQQYKKDGRE